MDIHLTDSDISQMPEPGRTLFLNWLPQHLNAKSLKSHPATACQPPRQLELLASQQVRDCTSTETTDRSHVRLTQLFDAGITQYGMPVRVRLKRALAKKLGRDYIDGIEVSANGTIVYKGQEFDKPSPLAETVNSGSLNGWEYIEVKKDCWICLDELRTIWRKKHD